MRRISNKLILAMVTAVIVPFAAFTFFVDTQMADRLSREVVRHTLLGLASDLAERVDRRVQECNDDLALWTQSPLITWAIDEHDAVERGDRISSTYRNMQSQSFDAEVEARKTYDLILLLDSEGKLVASNRRDSRGVPFPALVQESLELKDFSETWWFREAMNGGTPRIDPHVSDLLPLKNLAPGHHAENYQIAIAGAVESPAREGPAGVVYGLANWKHFQDEVSQPVLKAYFQGLVGREGYPSAYGWIWAQDADTILAHPNIGLYGERVSGPRVALPQLVEAARSEDWGWYPEYPFQGKTKNAAFKRCPGAEDGGFGWVVGVGINNDDIYATVRDLEGLLYAGTAVVVLLVVLWTMVIARRTTSPILALKRHTEEVARGDLDKRIAVTSNDEVGELAQAFNRMTAELSENRKQLVRAEKDAAWREMARQVAHDIKNPLTPIQLSADLLKRARKEGSEDFDEIFDRTMDTISRQVSNLRAIASDFHALTGSSRHNPRPFDAGQLMDEVLELNSAWAEELHVTVHRSGGGGALHLDPDQLRRVLINLVSNAFEAMPEGGELFVEVETMDAGGGEFVAIEVRDTGTGVSKEVLPHLFEPYFTTRSKGTGLGLAIARRVVEEMGGTISIEPAPEDLGSGTVARILLPRTDGGE